MAAGEERLRVPVALRARVREIVELTDALCADRLDSEYAELCRRLVAKLARKRPSPIERGETRVWAAGAVYAIGQFSLRLDPDAARGRRRAERPDRGAQEHDGREGQADPRRGPVGRADGP